MALTRTQVKGTYYTVFESASGTSAAPTTATQGLALKDLVGLTVVVSADSGATLSGAGTLRCYVYDADIARWTRCPAADLSVTASAVRDQMFSSFQVLAPRADRIEWAADTVTLSGGGVTVHHLGHCPKNLY
jgi:hypothetical protein